MEHLLGTRCRKIFWHKVICIWIAVCVILLPAGCKQTQDSDVSAEAIPAPAASFTPPLSDRYWFNKDAVMYEVTVDQVFQNKYRSLLTIHEEKSLVLLCTIKQVFYPEADQGAVDNDEAARISLWVAIDGIEASEEALRKLFSEADSFIIYGRKMDVWIADNSEEGQKWLSEDGQANMDVYSPTEFGEVFFKLPQCIRVCDLDNWTIFPLKNGKFVADGIIEALQISDCEMCLDVDEEDQTIELYFKNGDSSEKMYEEIRKFVLQREPEDEED